MENMLPWMHAYKAGQPHVNVVVNVLDRSHD